VAKGFGIPAGRVDVEKGPEAGIAALAQEPGPYLLEAIVHPDNYVYPIIPPGCSNVEMFDGQKE